MTAKDKEVLLIVEDNPSDLELTVRALTRGGYTGPVICAKDGAEALDLLFGKDTALQVDHVPKAIFLDLKLPKVTGLEVLRKVRADARTELYPVIILTSSKEERDIKEAYRLGVNSYIVKPIDFEQFSATVKALSHYWLSLNQGPLA